LGNQGTLQVTAGTFEVHSAANNTGTINVFGGHFFLGGGWTNSGFINLTGGALSMGGIFPRSALANFNQQAGLVEFVGRMDDTVQTLAVSASRPWQIGRSGNRVGGMVTSIDGTPLLASGSGTLESLSLGVVRVAGFRG